MKSHLRTVSGIAALALAALPVGLAMIAPAAPAHAQTTGEVNVLSIGRGKQINLSSPVTDVFIANPEIADVDVKSPRQLYIFGKGQGETTVYATDANGRTVYSSTIRVGGNIDSIDQMLRLTMPDAQISTATMNGIVLLTGTVANPDDAEEAERLVKAFVDEKTKVVSRLQIATPLQVNLRVRIAEVSRELSKEINSNLASRDSSNGFLFGINRGRPDAVGIKDMDLSGFPKVDASSLYGLPAGTLELPFNPATGQFMSGGTTFDFKSTDPASVINLAGKLFGVDVGAAFDLSEKAGLTTTLAEPNLTTISGETGSFHAGGEFPIAVSGGLGTVSIQYKQYGVLLSYTPTVLSNGRISLRVRPEVSDIDSNNSISLNGYSVPGFLSRSAETTVELGSGQSIMIAGLMSNSSRSQVDKIPGAGDVPIIGNLFKSNAWRRNETELVIVITPYLVKPTDDSKIKLPTDGFQTPTDVQRLLFNKQSDGKNGGERPGPTVRSEVTAAPGFDNMSAALPGQVPMAPPPAPVEEKKKDKKHKKSDAKAADSSPGFSF